MAIVKITPTNEKSVCTAGETCRAQFSVSNTSGGFLLCGVQISSQDNVNDWINIEGSVERKIEEDIDTTITLEIAPPKDLLNENDAPKIYAFRLRVYNAKEPEDTVDSPTVSVTVKPAKAENSKPFPWLWVLLGAILAIVVIGGIIWALQGTPPSQKYTFVDAVQISTYGAGDAKRAIDGNTDGKWGSNSITHTSGFTNHEWWQGDLGESRDIGRIVLYNRTDCCAERLSNFYILISDEDLKNLSPSKAQEKANRSFYYSGTMPSNYTWEIPAKTQGRYVMIMLSSKNNVSLAEVEAFSPGDW
ncbi:MAG: hypothetical protein ACI82Z_001719 [Cellvibrionaceae bacterium]